MRMSTTSPAHAETRAVLADTLSGGRARDALIIIGGVGLMSLLAQVAISVPPSPVPITGQTLGVVLVGATLGSGRGTSSMLLYLLAGILLPIYAAGASGTGVLFGASGGYLVGFVLATYVIGRFAESRGDRRFVPAFFGFGFAQLVVFAVGVPWLKIATGMNWSTAVHDGFVIFMVGGIVKALLAALLLPGAWKLVKACQA
jgi:biotin transport system substrate-specific component